MRGVIAASTAAGSSAKSSSKPGRDEDRRPAGEHDRRDVGHVRRLVEDDLVARVAGRPQREVDRLRRPDRDQDLGRRVVADAVAALEVVGERAAQLERPEVGRVVRPALAQALDAGLHDDPRRVEVGLPHPEADDVVHRREDVEEPPDARRRAHALGPRAASGALGAAGGRSIIGRRSTMVGHALGRGRASTGRRGRRGPPVPASRQSAVGGDRLVAARPARTAPAPTRRHRSAGGRPGRPSDSPAGIEIPGSPAMLTGSVQASDRYIETGSARRAPNRNATVGRVGATRASKPCAQSASKSPLISVRTFWAFR